MEVKAFTAGKIFPAMGELPCTAWVKPRGYSMHGIVQIVLPHLVLVDDEICKGNMSLMESCAWSCCSQLSHLLWKPLGARFHGHGSRNRSFGAEKQQNLRKMSLSRLVILIREKSKYSPCLLVLQEEYIYLYLCICVYTYLYSYVYYKLLQLS